MTPKLFSEWRPLDAAEITVLPESPGVFEIATLVRNVLFIGAAPESLATTLASHLETPGMLHAGAGRLYFHYVATEEAERLQSELLAKYRERHAGTLPAAQTTTTSPSQRPQRHLKAV
jgi:hypothetical protein